MHAPSPAARELPKPKRLCTQDEEDSAYVPGENQDQEAKDVDRWMKINQQVILVLLYALLPSMPM